MKNFKEFSEIFNSIGLFKGINSFDLERMLDCIGARPKKYKKGNIILFAGDRPDFVGIVLSGLLHIIQEDYDGNRSLIAVINPGEIFAEALCCAGVPESPVTVVSSVDSTVMSLSFPRILNRCPNSCFFHNRLLENLLGLIANRNLLLQSRMEILSLKSIRARVLIYLESFIPKQGKNITIPFNREEMADFLSVERSALSHELAKMKKDGLIEYRKNRFTLKNI